MQVKQIPMLRHVVPLLACKDKLAAVRGGVGSGKTYALAWWLWMRSEEYPKAAHFVVGADYEQLRRGFFQTLVGILENEGLEEGPDYHYRESPSPMILFKHNGSRIRSLSAELAERIRSTEFQTLVIEEPQTWHNGESTYGTTVLRLRHNPKTSKFYGSRLQPQMRMSFNPTREAAIGTWLHTLIEKQWTRAGYQCWRFSVRDNYLMTDRDEYVKLIEDNMPQERWPSEIDGHWCTSGGQVYRTFDRVLNCTPAPGLPPFQVDRSQPLCWSLDFNVGWMASHVSQWHTQELVYAGMGPTDIRTGISKPIHKPAVEGYQKRLLYVLDELFLSDAGSPDVADEFIRRWGEIARQTGVVLYGDATAGGRSQTASSQSSARSNWAIIVQALIAAGIRVEMRIPTTNPSVGNRINATNAQFRTGSGIGMIVDEQKCPQLLADFAQVKYVVGKNDIDKLDKTEEGVKRTHCSDEIGYICHTERAIADNELSPKQLRDIAQFMAR
jgi:hypothetical protein